jgi:transposase InsO family protein
MDRRHQFVIEALEPDRNMAALCRKYGISRRVGYKWVTRFREGGKAALADMRRTPSRSPLKCSGEVVASVVALRRAHPSWGPKKLRRLLEDSLPASEVPTSRTVGRILRRCGMSAPKRRIRFPSSSPDHNAAVLVEAPNDLWTVDFKGWWRSRDGSKCEPLTVRDAHSRLLLAVQILKRPKTEFVLPVFERLFRLYGMPKAIRTDNGPPFAVARGLGITRLSVFWMRHGIRHVRGRPACPQDNGGHERMHRDLKAALQRNPASTPIEQQSLCDAWRHEFNEVRPHEALGMETPASVYLRSERVFPNTTPELVYPEHLHRRRISRCGMMRYRGFQRTLSTSLFGCTVAIEQLQDDRFRVFLGEFVIGEGLLPWNTSLTPPKAVSDVLIGRPPPTTILADSEPESRASPPGASTLDTASEPAAKAARRGARRRRRPRK